MSEDNHEVGGKTQIPANKLQSVTEHGGGWYSELRGSCYEDRSLTVLHDGWVVAEYLFSAREDRWFRSRKPTMEAPPPLVMQHITEVTKL